jgi:hypothetical protein
MEIRRSARSPAQRPSKIIIGPNLPPILCTVIDVADGGVGLWIGTTFGIPDQFELLIEGELARRVCRVAWKDSHKLGVSFQ